MIIGIVYIFKTYDFMDKIKGNGIYENYYVVVKKDSKYDNVDSLTRIYAYNEYTDSYKDVINEIDNVDFSKVDDNY